ncbi:MAG: pyruvate, phosphate dikinase [Desulfobacteraceae bacterium]|nr:MAG: pyruvate, phosphate dikinase [Desulfobacteraceae bacterium]
MIQSKALEVNLATSRVDVAVEPKYEIFQELLSGYYGLMDGLTVFLKELSHPYRNWQFIVKEARGYSLNYFHLLKNHPRGPEAAALYIDIFSDAVRYSSDPLVRADAVDNLLLFLQKIVKEASANDERFGSVLNHAFLRIKSFDTEGFFLFIRSYYQIKKIADLLVSRSSGFVAASEALLLLLIAYYQHSYAYWLDQADPQQWFEKEAEIDAEKEGFAAIFNDISHRQLIKYRQHLMQFSKGSGADTIATIGKLIGLPGYSDIIEQYRSIPQKLFVAGGAEDRGNRWKLIFTFQIMNITGLSMIHEEALRDINRTLTWVISHEEPRHVEFLVRKTFSILTDQTRRFPDATLNCVLNMGKAVYDTENGDLINFFIDSVIDLGFQMPMIGGIGNDWQIRVNRAHILNIRIWLELIELNPKLSTRLISALVIHISLCGVFIKDTDLFPRDITRFLNSDFGPVYNLVKQLTRLFPTYFNDIGAEGRLRDISTRIDELCSRKDVLVHFLRKQSHVESSNRIIGFMEAAFTFWEARDKSILEPFVPPAIYHQIDSGGPYVDGMHRAVAHLRNKGVAIPKGLLALKETQLRTLLEDVSGVRRRDLERATLAVSFYKLLNQKYNLDFFEIDQLLCQIRTDYFPDIHQLKSALSEPGLKERIDRLLDYLGGLKSLILSPKTYDIREDIYKKRHFTVDIPSMYGSYHEVKFDALGLTFRLESLVNVLFEELIQDIDLNVITKATFFQVYDRLLLFYKALKLDGITSVEIERQLDFLNHSLRVRGFTFTQYLDIFKGFAGAVKTIITDYFSNVHERNLSRILQKIPNAYILPKYLPKDNDFDHEKLEDRVSEIFSRERIAMSLGLQQLDRFLTRILNTLFYQSDKLSKVHLQQLLLYDPERAMAAIEDADRRVYGIIHLGNKGLNLVRLKEFGLPIPPGFIVTTEVFRCREVIHSYTPAIQQFREQVAHQIAGVEEISGFRFGDPSNPLLFSVRSGSSISQPGMMDTFLDVGINQEIVEGIFSRTGNEWFAWDSYRRFLQCYGMSFDLKRDDFDAIISDFKRRLGIPYKKNFSGDQMKRVALEYKKLILDSGIPIEEDPFEQLLLIIRKVLDSWESAKAKTYRQIMGISDDWGTAVTVQTMVYGNISQQSGSGVIFTHNPRWSGDNLRLWGDFTIGNQGEDVVSGLVRTLPVSIIQQDFEMRETDITLETNFSEIYGALKAWANELIYGKGWSPQEIEFTFESPSVKDLYILQSRDMTIRSRKEDLSFDLEKIRDKKLLGHGIGVSGGAMSGRIVFNLEEISAWRQKDSKMPLILVRSDTVPDDIREIHASDGLLTARGGLTSHAAVIAHRLEKTCVVGCADLFCNERLSECSWGAKMLKSGDWISIDGQQGAVYFGKVKVKAASRV